MLNIYVLRFVNCPFLIKLKTKSFNLLTLYLKRQSILKYFYLSSQETNQASFIEEASQKMPLNIFLGAMTFGFPISAVHLFHCVIRNHHSVKRRNCFRVFTESVFSLMSVRVITEKVFLTYTMTPSSCILQEVHPHHRFPRNIVKFPPFRKQHQGTLKNVESSFSPSMLTYNIEAAIR